MTSYTDGILHELRQRLAIVRRRIGEHEQTPLGETVAERAEYLHSAGALSQLRCEQLFLTQLLAEIEKMTA